jgi:hypothetical protein
MTSLEDFQRHYPRLSVRQQQIALSLCRGWDRELIEEELRITTRQYRHALRNMLRDTGAITPWRLTYLLGCLGVDPLTGPPLSDG